MTRPSLLAAAFALASLAMPAVHAQAFTVVQEGAYVPPAPPAPPVPTWHFGSDQDLHQILSQWAQQAGWVAVFEPAAEAAARTYRPAISGSIAAPAVGGAVTDFFNGLDASVPLRVELRTANSPRVIYITTSR